MMEAVVERRAYVARCLRCGLSGPTGEDGTDAKRPRSPKIRMSFR